MDNQNENIDITKIKNFFKTSIESSNNIEDVLDALEEIEKTIKNKKGKINVKKNQLRKIFDKIVNIRERLESGNASISRFNKDILEIKILIEYQARRDQKLGKIRDILFKNFIDVYNSTNSDEQKKTVLRNLVYAFEYLIANVKD